MAVSEPLSPNLMTILRSELRAAKEAGTIRDWVVRKGGRATIYVVGGGKVYTTGWLDTLTFLKHEQERLQKTTNMKDNHA
jgi:ribosome-interacting GTPase 1